MEMQHKFTNNKQKAIHGWKAQILICFHRLSNTWCDL